VAAGCVLGGDTGRLGGDTRRLVQCNHYEPAED
jgi:hypothetical protein